MATDAVNRDISASYGAVVCGITGIIIAFFCADIENVNNLIIDVILFFLFVLCFMPLVVNLKKKQSDVFKPIILIPLLFFLYYGVGYYLCIYRLSFTGGADSDYLNVIMTGLMIAVIGVIFFYAGHFVSSKVFSEKKLFQEYSYRFSQRQLLSFIVAVILFYSTVNLFLWSSVGGIPVFIPDYYREARTELMAGKGYFYFIALSVWPVSLLIINLYIYLKTKPSFLLKSALAVLFCLTITILVLNVERGVFIAFLGYMIVNYHYLVKKLNVKKIIIIFLIMVFLAGFGGYLRTAQWSEKEWLFWNVLLLEALPEFDSYIEVIRVVPEHLELQMGRTIIPILTIPIPRALLPDKDDFKPAGVVFKEFFGHEYIRVGERMTIIGELFMNFHIFGVIAGMFLFGLLTMFIEKKFYPKTKNPVNVLFYTLILMTLVSQVAGDIASSFLSFVMVILPVLFIYIFWNYGRIISGKPNRKKLFPNTDLSSMDTGQQIEPNS